MGESKEACEAQHELPRTLGRERREDADRDFHTASANADEHGLTLIRCSEQHYQLTDGEWVQNIYPGNQRLYYDRNHGKPPYLKLPTPWTLLDVVMAAGGQS